MRIHLWLKNIIHRWLFTFLNNFAQLTKSKDTYKDKSNSTILAGPFLQVFKARYIRSSVVGCALVKVGPLRRRPGNSWKKQNQDLDKMSLGKRKSEPKDNSIGKQARQIETGRKSETARQSETSFFDGLKIHLHPAALGPVRKKIFEKQVQSHGGELVPDLTNSSYPKLIIVLDNLSIEASKLKSLVDKCDSVSPVSEKIFVGTSWLSGCLEQKEFVPYEPFLIKRKSNQIKLEATVNLSKSEDQPSKGDNSDSEDSKYGVPRKAISTSKFVCAQSSSNPTSTNLNEAITQELEKLAQTYKSKNDRFVG